MFESPGRTYDSWYPGIYHFGGCKGARGNLYRKSFSYQLAGRFVQKAITSIVPDYAELMNILFTLILVLYGAVIFLCNKQAQHPKNGLKISFSRLQFASQKQIIIKTKFHAVTHCIFDLDGTLLDSEIIYHQVIAKICKQNNKEYTKELKEKLKGATDAIICKTVCSELNLDMSPAQLEKQMAEMIHKQLPSAPYKVGAEQLLNHLRDNNIPFALGTNSTSEAVRVHTKAKPKFFKMFHHVVTIDDRDVLRGKPQPDIFLLAAARFDEKPKPHKCLVFEDTPAGVQAARAAGMQVVMIPDKKLSRQMKKQATLTLPSLLHFKPKLFGLPPFKKKLLKRNWMQRSKIRNTQ